MLKKLSGVLIATGMVMGISVFSVFATNYSASVTGWTSSFYQTPTDETGLTAGATGVKIITDSAMVPSGTGALQVFCEKDLGNLNANAVQSVKTLVTGKQYRLTGKFWVARDSWRFRLMFGNTALGDKLSTITNGTVQAWTNVDYTFTFNYTSTDFKIQASGGGSVYADDLSIKEVLFAEDGVTVTGYGPELLTNGNFEDDFVQPDDATFVNVASRDGANYISVTTPYPSAAIYALDNSGNQTKLSLSTVLENTMYNLKVYAHTGLTNGTVYRYLVKTVSAHGIESNGVTVSGVPASEYSNYITANGWNYKNNGANYGTLEIKKGIGVDGSAAMLLNNMSDSNADNTYLYLKNNTTITLNTENIYKLTYWTKAGVHNTRTDSFVVRMTNSQVSTDSGVTYTEAGKDALMPDVPNDGQWHEQVLYVKPASDSNNIELRVYRHFESLALDNFTLYQVDGSLNVIDGAQDMLAGSNGDFEQNIVAGTMTCEYKFYPAYETGEIMDEAGISTLTDLKSYDTDVLYGEATIKNQAYESGKDFTLIMAMYKDGKLSQIKSMATKAAYVPAFASAEKFGMTYIVPDLDTGSYEVKLFVWSDIDLISPLFPGAALAEN